MEKTNKPLNEGTIIKKGGIGSNPPPSKRPAPKPINSSSNQK